ncbi:MAG: PAS domain S-box protein, partial [Bryobacterales bacterium]|nr:PAS domain S-box protein [Bryobacterales bacterium]
MQSSDSIGRDSLVLLHAPIGRDARLLQEVLWRAKIESLICGTVESLCQEMERGAGAVFVTEEALDPEGVKCLATALLKQGAWSELPVTVLTVRGEPSQAARSHLAELRGIGDLALLERPLRADTIISAAKTALRARAKQYEVRGREAELQLVADNVPVLISYIDTGQVFRRVNRTYSDWFGKRPEEVVGRSIREVAGEPHVSIAAPYIARVLAGERVSFESRVRDKQNEIREVAVSYAPDVSPGGNVRGFSALVQDITDRKRAQRRQAMLLELGARQRGTADPGEILRAAAEAIGSHLGADAAGLFEVEGEGLAFREGWSAGELRAMPGGWLVHSLGGDVLARLRAGERVARGGEGGVAGGVCAPIRRGGEWCAALYVEVGEARHWRPDELELVAEVGAQTWDAVERARALAGLRASEARFRFLAQLDDATRGLTDASEISLSAARLLTDHLGVNRCAYADVEDDEDTFNLSGDYNREVASIVGRYRFREFGEECLRRMREGLPYVVTDAETDAGTEAVREAYRATQIRAVICVSLRKGGRVVAAMAVHQKTPREWTAEDVELVQQVGNRCWESIERSKVARVLKEREERFRFLAESIPQMVWTSGPDGRLQYMNGKGAAFFAVAAEELVGRGWLDRVHEEDREEAAARWRDSVETGEPYEMFLRFPRGKDGVWRWHLVRALALRTEGRVVQWFGTSTDIDDQKATEAELKRTNRELEEFAYVSSHDLQEPLRMVNTYTQLLLRELGPQISPELSQYAGFIRGGVKRMEALIRDLLAYSRAGHYEGSREVGRADLGRALQRAMTDLNAALLDTGA